MACYAHENVDLLIASANDNSERQMEQINDFINRGVDLLIVSPNQLSTISAAIDRATQKGIRVILFDRKSDTDNFTAFIGADNYEMGRLIGEHIAALLNGVGNVVEVQGLKGSSPAIERHNGFAAAIARHPGLHLLATLEGDWTEKSGRKAMESWLDSAAEAAMLPSIDFVFGQNDRMAVGARKALIKHHPADSQRPPLTTRFAGIDGLPGKGGGLQLVNEGVLSATYVYPTGGDQVLKLAMHILENKAFERENILETTLVTSDNAPLLLMQAKETERQTENIEALHSQGGRYASLYTLQRIVLVLLTFIVLIMLAFILIQVRSNRAMAQLNQQLLLRNKEIEEQKKRLEESKEQQRRLTNEIKQITRTQTPFVAKLRNIVLDHLSDPDFNVNQLADEMAMSRVQLYRKVKAQTGITAVEFIRNIRLEQAHELFEQTDLNVSQVADRTGFATIQYFTKCFREEYGLSPSAFMRKS